MCNAFVCNSLQPTRFLVLGYVDSEHGFPAADASRVAGDVGRSGTDAPDLGTDVRYLGSDVSRPGPDASRLESDVGDVVTDVGRLDPGGGDLGADGSRLDSDEDDLGTDVGRLFRLFGPGDWTRWRWALTSTRAPADVTRPSLVARPFSRTVVSFQEYQVKKCLPAGSSHSTPVLIELPIPEC